MSGALIRRLPVAQARDRAATWAIEPNRSPEPPVHRIHHPAGTLGLACLLTLTVAETHAAEKPHLFQSPALSRELIAFGYAGDLWTVSREGGRAIRLTNGVGLESAPVFSPDGSTIAFTGEYDGNTDVFTIPAAGGIPHRVTYHPAPDVAVGWTPDGKRILFRSAREAASRYTQLFSVPAEGGVATRLPLPMAHQGQMSPDGSHIAYSPLPPAFGFDYTAFISWGNYRGGRASTIWITALAGLDSVEIPHDRASDFFPVYCGQQIFFLSGRAGHIGIFRYDPGTKTVAEALHNDGPDIRSLAGEGNTLVYDQLGEIHLLDTAGGKDVVDVTGASADLALSTGADDDTITLAASAANALRRRLDIRIRSREAIAEISSASPASSAAAAILVPFASMASSVFTIACPAVIAVREPTEA